MMALGGGRAHPAAAVVLPSLEAQWPSHCAPSVGTQLTMVLVSLSLLAQSR